MGVILMLLSLSPKHLLSQKLSRRRTKVSSVVGSDVPRRSWKRWKIILAVVVLAISWGVMLVLPMVEYLRALLG
jgi:hypothetical protein